jgi:endonuclease/exonuclease/phosphatase (EEP) superfamily protein YafD
MRRALRSVLELLLIGAAAALALWSLAALGGSISDNLDVLTHFAPIAAAASLVLLASVRLLMPRGRRRLSASVLAGAASLWSATLLVPELLALPQPAPPAGATTLKIVTFNVWALNGDPEASADWVKAQKADLVLMQETDGPHAEALLAGLRDAYPHGAVCTEVRCSLAVLSPWPASNTGVQRQRWRAPSWSALSAAWADFETPAGRFTALTTHYTWPTQVYAQERQRAGLVHLARRHDPRDLILTGDFNLTPWSKALQEQDGRLGLERRTRGMFSWPAWFGGRAFPLPLLPIDHVYAGSDWRTVSVRRGPRLGSDHYPLVVVLARVPPGRSAGSGARR